MSEKTKIKIGLLSACAVALSYMGFSPIIANIAASFPDVNISLVQMVLTIPNFMFIIFSPLAGTLMLHYRKKNLLIISIAMYIVGGLIPFFFHSNIWYLLIGSMIIGSGSGLMMPVLNGIICEFFDLDERGPLMGLNATFVAAGALIFIFFSGFLSSKGWHYSYLVFFLLIPILIANIFLLPKGSVPSKQENGKRGGMEKSGIVFFVFIIGFIYFITQNAFNTNSSLIVPEYSIGFDNAASLLTLLNTIGGLVGGIIFGFTLKKCKDNILTLAVSVAGIGFLIAGLLHFFAPVLVGAIMVGFGFATFSAGGTFVVSKYTKPENTDFTIAIYNGFVNLGAALSPYFINSIAGLFGKTIAVKYVMSGIILLVLGIIFSFGLVAFRKRVFSK